MHTRCVTHVDQVIEHLSYLTFCNAHELREFLVLESREALGDVSWTRPGCVVQLIAELEPTLEVRLRKVSIDLHLELIRRLATPTMSRKS